MAGMNPSASAAVSVPSFREIFNMPPLGRWAMNRATGHVSGFLGARFAGGLAFQQQLRSSVQKVSEDVCWTQRDPTAPTVIPGEPPAGRSGAQPRADWRGPERSGAWGGPA